jgi:hypothetical protein
MERWMKIETPPDAEVSGSARFQRAVFGILPKTEHHRMETFGRMPNAARWKRALPSVFIM